METSFASLTVTITALLLAAAATALTCWGINDYCLSKHKASVATLLSRFFLKERIQKHKASVATLLSRFFFRERMQKPHDDTLIIIVTDKGIFNGDTPLYWGRPDEWIVSSKELTVIEDGISTKIPISNR